MEICACQLKSSSSAHRNRVIDFDGYQTLAILEERLERLEILRFCKFPNLLRNGTLRFRVIAH